MKLVDHFGQKRTGLTLLKLSLMPEIRQGSVVPCLQEVAPKLGAKTFIWTREEAEGAWLAKRTEYNLAQILPKDVNSIESISGGFIVDGKGA